MNCFVSECKNGKHCTQHLEKDDNLDCIEGENIELKATVALENNYLESLQFESSQDDTNVLRTGDAVDSLKTPAIISTSTANTDICILESHESHYGSVSTCHWLEDKSSDFTMLHAPQLKVTNRFFPTSTLNDSTEVILIHSENEATPGTDSDVEVLLTEEVVDSDWSAGRSEAAIEVLEFGADSDHFSIDNGKLQNEDSAAAVNNCTSADFVKRRESTDLDVSVEEFSNNSTRSYDHLSRSQLLEVIRQLEATILRYRNAQQRLFEQVDALRIELNDNLTCTNVDDKSRGQ